MTYSPEPQARAAALRETRDDVETCCENEDAENMYLTPSVLP